MGPAAAAVARLVVAAPWILALILAVSGRWAPARILVLAATVPSLLLMLPPRDSWASILFHWLWPTAGTALLLVAPPDLVDLSRRGRSGLAAATAALALPIGGLNMLSRWAGGLSAASSTAWADRIPLWAGTVLALALLSQLRATHPDPLRTTGTALTALPWAAMFGSILLADNNGNYVIHPASPSTYTGFSLPGCLPVLLALAVTLAVHLMRGRNGPPAQART